MQPHSFSKRQLAAIALNLDGKKNAPLSEKETYVVSQVFRKQKIRMRILDCAQIIS
jgi:hypothetical protein